MTLCTFSLYAALGVQGAGLVRWLLGGQGAGMMRWLLREQGAGLVTEGDRGLGW